MYANSNRLPLDTIPSDRFTWSCGFSAEMSDLRPWNLFRRIYTDAVDVGFNMLSSRTNKVLAFYFEREERNSENEITMWRFRSVDERFEVVVFND